MTSRASDVGPYAAGYRAGLKPERRRSVAEWADAHAYLSAESAADPGKWKSLPYQVGILDAFSDPEITYIAVMKSARVGYTKCLNHVIGYHMSEAPCPIMVVQPTLTDAQGYSRSELTPMIRDTPVLNGLVKLDMTKGTGNTILNKVFPGGNLVMVGANSATGFRRHSIRVLLFDEVDGYPLAAGAEGDQIALGIRRTEYYWNRKIAIGGTPTLRGLSRVETYFERGDQRRYFVPCPECGHQQTLKWRGLQWEDGKPETVRYACEECGSLIPHSKKRWMVERGEWRATNTDAMPGHASFHIWAAYSYSPNATWEVLVREFLAAKRDRETLRTFINTVLGETWEDASAEPIVASEVMARADGYHNNSIPDGVLVLTAGVDTQADRLEIEILGTGLDEESWSVDYLTLVGNPGMPEVWTELERVLGSTYTTTDGRQLSPVATCIDSGGLHTQAVYDFCRGRMGHRVYAIKGSSLPGRPIAGPPHRVKKHSVSLVMVGTDSAKDLIHARLKIDEPGPGYCHFPRRYDEEYYAQLTAERAVTVYRKGIPHREWRKMRDRNEALDCRVYALAALRLLRPNLPVIAAKTGANDRPGKRSEAAHPVSDRRQAPQQKRPRRGKFQLRP